MTKKSFKPILFSIILINFCLLVCYLFQIEGLIRNNYSLQSYKQEIKEIENHSSIIGQQTTKSFSMEKIEKEIITLGFVGVSKIKYIPISSDYLANAISR